MKRLILILSVLLLSACETTPKTNNLDSSIWSSGQTKLAVVTAEFPEPGYYKLGSQGLLDLAINSALGKGINAKILEQSPAPFLELQDEVVERFAQKNVDAVVYSNRISLNLKLANNENDKLNSNEPHEYNAGKKDELNVEQVIADTEADKVLVLQLVKFGASRHYYSFTPLGPPKGYAQVQAFLVDKNNIIEWQLAKYNGIEIDESVIGEWNQKPDYSNIMKSSDKAIQTAKDYILNAIFKDSV